MRQLILSSFVALLLVAPASAEELSLWETDLDTARQEAATSGRMVLIHFWAPWCGPCMQLDKAVLSKPTVLADLRRHVVPVKLNVDQNEAAAAKYGVKSLPCDAIISPQGELIKLVSSPRNAAAYVTQISTVAIAAKEEIASRYNPAAAGLAAATNNGTPAASMPADFNGRVATNVSAGAVVATDEPGADEDVLQAQESPAAAEGTSLADLYDRPAFDDAPPPAAPARNSAPPDYDQSPPSEYDQPPAADYDQPPVSDAGSTPPAGVRPVASEPAAELQLPAGSPPLGLDGFCPVHLAEGKKWLRGDTRYGAIHRGRTYLFGSESCQKKFLSNPDRFSPVMQGNDVIVALEAGQEVPGRREFGVFYGDHVYLFANEANRDRFENEHQRFAEAAAKVVK
ncbi:MAG: thioredoxin family protein [Pirellulales bacterium]